MLSHHINILSICMPLQFVGHLLRSSMVGLITTSSKRTYAIPTPRAPVPVADHRQPVPLQQMLTDSSISVSVGSLDAVVHKVCLSTVSISGKNGVCF